MTEHGIADVAIIERYRLGYVAEPLYSDERFRGMLSIPYLTVKGGVRAIRFRNLTGDKPKYAQPHGQPLQLYNTAAYFSAGDTIALSEGEVDAIACTERLGMPCMGLPGAMSWQDKKETWLPIFKDFRLVLIMADGDDVGKEMAETVADSIGWRAQVIQCPAREDVAHMVATGEGGFLRDRIRAAERM